MKQLLITVGVAAVLVCSSSQWSHSVEPVCRKVNMNGRLDNASAIADSMNRWLVSKNIDYMTSAREIDKVVKSYCISHPKANSDEVTRHLEELVLVLSSIPKDSAKQ